LRIRATQPAEVPGDGEGDSSDENSDLRDAEIEKEE
jgi:hypothetical protein